MRWPFFLFFFVYLFCVCVRVCVSLGRFEFGVPVGRVVPDVLCYVVLALILVLIANVS